MQDRADLCKIVHVTVYTLTIPDRHCFNQQTFIPNTLVVKTSLLVGFSRFSPHTFLLLTLPRCCAFLKP